MGLSFHDQESMVEAISSLHFVSNNPNPETGSIGIEGQERSEDVDIEVSNRDILWSFHSVYLRSGQIRTYPNLGWPFYSNIFLFFHFLKYLNFNSTFQIHHLSAFLLLFRIFKHPPFSNPSKI